MAKVSENALIIPLVMIFGLAGLVIMGWFFSADLVEGDAGGTVTVSATVGTSVSCDSDTEGGGDATDFGTITIGGSPDTADSYASTTMSCNYGPGCTLSVMDRGDDVNAPLSPGLASTTAGYLIPSSITEATSTLVSGTEGYGIQASSTGWGSGTYNVSQRYDIALLGANDVGNLATTTLELASSTEPITKRELIIEHIASISGLTEAAKYDDVITYSCLGND